jgi:hypothetical protein
MVPAEVADQRGELPRVGQIAAQEEGEDKLLQNVPGSPDSFLII